MHTQGIHISKPKSHHGHSNLAPTARHKELVKQSQKWVSQTFYGAMLKQMRQSPFKDKIFSGGRGGEAFGEMFDQQLADRMGRSSGSKLVNSLVKKMEGSEGKAAEAAAKKKAPPVAAALRAYAQNQFKASAK